MKTLTKTAFLIFFALNSVASQAQEFEDIDLIAVQNFGAPALSAKKISDQVSFNLVVHVLDELGQNQSALIASRIDLAYLDSIQFELQQSECNVLKSNTAVFSCHNPNPVHAPPIDVVAVGRSLDGQVQKVNLKATFASVSLASETLTTVFRTDTSLRADASLFLTTPEGKTVHNLRIRKSHLDSVNRKL